MTGLYSLSSQQRRAWELFETGYAPRVIFQFALTGQVDARRVRESVQSVLDAAEIFRTTLEPVPGHAAPGQRVHSRPLAVGLVAPAEAAALVAAWELNPVQVEALVWTAGPDQVSVSVALPATHGDIATGALLLAAIADRYEGRPATAPDIQYADVAGWLEDLRDDARTVRQAERWSDLVLQARGSATAPFAWPPAPRAPRRTAVVPVQVGPLPAGLSPNAEEALLLATWRIVLSRLTGDKNLAIGVASSGRGHDDLVSQPGPLECVLPVIGRPQGRDSLEEVVASEAARLEEARSTELSFTWPAAEAGVHPHLLPYGFRYDRWPASRSTGQDVTVRMVSVADHTEPAGVQLRCSRKEAELSAELVVYDQFVPLDLIPEVGRQFTTAFAQVALGSPASVGTVRLTDDNVLSDALAAGIGDEHAGIDDAPFLYELVSRQWEQTPAATALVCGSEHVTYAELRTRVENLADRLTGTGAASESVVVGLFSRGIDAVVALLATMGAGAIYAPIDLTNPPQRITAMLDHLQPVAVLGTIDRRIQVPSTAAILERTAVEGAPGSRVRPRPDPLGGAFLLHTSGSTGRPKPVLLTHGGLCNRLDWARRNTAVRAGDHVLWAAGLAMDFTLYEVLVPLCAGAEIVVPDAELDTVPSHLLDVMSRHGVTIAHFTPSLLWLLLEEPDLSALGALRMLLVGGEPLDANLLSAVRDCTTAEIVNQYGPTEASIDVTAWTVASGSRPAAVSIGRPIDNVSVHLLDADLQPVPPGVVGELWLGGVGLARGYWRMPAATAERFVPAPFGAPGSRLYRSGDLGRRRVDGELEFIGRRDSQVNLNGYRVELDEVEAALHDTSGVKRAAALVQYAESGAARLVAFAVVSEPLDNDTLRARVAELLPHHLVPTAIRTLDRLPMAIGGKVDRAALAALSVDTSAVEYVPPVGNLETAIAQLWRQLLQDQGNEVEEVGRHHDFYQLGGHSLLTLRVLGFLHHSLEVSLPLRTLLAAPTVSLLAAATAAADPVPGRAGRNAARWLAGPRIV